MSLTRRLASARLLQGRGKERTLLQLCHAGRLVGGLSIDLRVTPDEAAGALTHAMGGEASAFKILDVKMGRPTRMDVQYLRHDPFDDSPRQRLEAWEVEDVTGLIHNLNDLYRQSPTVRPIAVLGEWEDMLQVWAVDRSLLRLLLAEGIVSSARNAEGLRLILDDT
jgi:hypothetical protein